jgi:hypothetical protein
MLSVLAQDTVFREEEAQRVGAYVRQYHDYPAVARRYSEILQARIPEITVPDAPEREQLITHTPPKPLTPAAPPVETPKKPVKQKPKRKPPETR